MNERECKAYIGMGYILLAFAGAGTLVLVVQGVEAEEWWIKWVCGVGAVACIGVGVAVARTLLQLLRDMGE